MKKVLTLFTGLLLSLSSTFALAYDNMFISYFHPENIKSMVKFAQANKLGGYIMWDLSSDVYYDDAQHPALLKTLANALKIDENDNSDITIMGYWPDWGVYTDATSRAIATDPYPITGSIDPNSGATVTNKHFDAQLSGLTTVVYAFLEAQSETYTYWSQKEQKSKTVINPHPEQYGQLYFNDPWSDLAASDGRCLTDDLWNSCMYVYLHRDPIDLPVSPIKENFGQFVKMGNFEAFANINHTGKFGKPIKKVISVGGWGHDDSFKYALKGGQFLKNFVDSAAKIINMYNLDGIDLDYENQQMTKDQSAGYVLLVDALHSRLPNTQITVTTFADPDYLLGKAGTDHERGFAAGDLQKIAQVAKKINLMTYDFHGTFDYAPKNQGKTGFLSNIYAPTGVPITTYKFSMDESVQTLKSAGVDASKIGIGMPAYGRSLQGISATNHGLFQNIPDVKVPKGDLDNATCSDDTISKFKEGSSCTGMFSYRYLVENALGKGLNETIWKNGKQHSDASNGVTAYGNWAPPKPSDQLTIKNSGAEGDLAFQVTIYNDGHTFQTYNWPAPGQVVGPFDSTTDPSTKEIKGQTELTVAAKTWKGTVTCPDKLDFLQATYIEIKVDPNNNIKCDFQPQR